MLEYLKFLKHKKHQTILQQPRPATDFTIPKQQQAMPTCPVSTPKQSVMIAKTPMPLKLKQDKIHLKGGGQKPIYTEPSPDYDGMSSVMQRQNYIVDLLVLQHKQALLTVRVITTFHGEPSSYTTFMCAFE